MLQEAFRKAPLSAAAVFVGGPLAVLLGGTALYFASEAASLRQLPEGAPAGAIADMRDLYEAIGIESHVVVPLLAPTVLLLLAFIPSALRLSYVLARGQTSSK